MAYYADEIPLVREMVMAGAFTQIRADAWHVDRQWRLSSGSLAHQRAHNPKCRAGPEIKNARERVTDGATISGPLAAGKVFLPMLTDMLAIGEETGDMAGALAHIARRYENMLDRSVKIFTTLLEPILISYYGKPCWLCCYRILLAVFDVTSGLNVYLGQPQIAQMGAGGRGGTTNTRNTRKGEAKSHAET